MDMEVTVKHVEKMAFVGQGPSAFPVSLDAEEAVGGEGRGARPMELILIGLGGCSGMDVVSILRKMRVEVSGFEVRLRGKRAEEHPRRLTSIEMEYVFFGDNLEESRDKIEKAVALSQEKYCGVAATLRGGVELSYRITLQSS